MELVSNIVLISDGHQRQLAVMTSVVSRVMVSRSTYIVFAEMSVGR